MNAIQQRCRPKHQVLVLKCYPRTTKGAVDVKPNSSELSYLLYYAASRKSKFQKVGSFLEKKTASDVWRLRIGNVQVTLQILEALIEKNPKDLPLFAPSVLRILDLVLKSNDISMVESSTATFEAFCANHDTSSLFADNSYLKQYESIVRQYASLASTRGSPGKTPPSKPVAMRWRNTGLEAIRSVASSDALASVSGRQYEVIVPMILENLWTDNEDFLEVLLQRAHLEEKVDTERLLKRRTSVATVRTAETGDLNPIALSGSAMDVDKLAEEDIGVLAMLCLKQIFIAPNRAQIHAATLALLRFIEERVAQDERVVKTHPNTGRDSGWAIKVFGLISRWAPVQERYVILVTAMDTLMRIPLTDETLQQHIVLVAMMGALLRSDVNLIGLSVMDVLLGLMQHMKRLVQLPGDPTGGSRAADAFVPGQPDPRSPTTLAADTAAETIASRRKELLSRIQQTIGDLATHVYYADQISDMIAAILFRLRPVRSNSPANSSPRGEKADGQLSATVPGARASSMAVSTSDEPQTVDGLFSLTVAKTAALKAIKSILLVANPRTKMAGNLGLARNKVPLQVWEGTQWLLRDPDGLVRKAYADALLTWLDRETTKADSRARDETAATSNPRASMRAGKELQNSVAKRAASSASTRKEAKPPRSHFLNLLHVAIYDNALQFVDYETDLVLLHIMLAKLVSQLGINAVRYGLPMIFRLQEDIQEAELPVTKVRLGSLVHGYFWILTEKFDFEVSDVGRAIHNEIIRRRSKGFWVDGVHVPPPLLELAGTPGLVRPQPKMPLHTIETEALLPFDDRLALVDCICTSYRDELAGSPPSSPAASPGRSFSHPILNSSISSIPAAAIIDPAEREVPTRFKDQMYAEWSRDAILTAVQAGSKSASLSGGSRAGTTGTANVKNNRLAVANGNGVVGSSPHGSQHNLRPASQPSPAGAGPVTLSPAAMKLRKSSVRSNQTPSPASSTAPRGGFVTSVDQLKMVLSGQLHAANLQAAVAGREDDSDDSLVSYDMASSELSFSNSQLNNQPHSTQVPPATAPAASSSSPGPSQGPSQRPVSAGGPRSRSQSRERKASIESFGASGGPLSSHPPHDVPLPHSRRQSEEGQDRMDDDEAVPPVPPLPEGISPPPTSPPPATPLSAPPRPRSRSQSQQSHAPFLPPVVQGESALRPARRSLRSRGGPPGSSAASASGTGIESAFSTFSASTMTDDIGSPGAMDLQSLLTGIDSRAGEHSLGNVTRPPY